MSKNQDQKSQDQMILKESQLHPSELDIMKQIPESKPITNLKDIQEICAKREVEEESEDDGEIDLTTCPLDELKLHIMGLEEQKLEATIILIMRCQNEKISVEEQK